MKKPNPYDFNVTGDQINQYHQRKKNSDEIFKRVLASIAILGAIIGFVLGLKESLFFAILFGPIIGAMAAIMPIGFLIAYIVSALYISSIHNRKSIERYLDYKKGLHSFISV